MIGSLTVTMGNGRMDGMNEKILDDYRKMQKLLLDMAGCNTVSAGWQRKIKEVVDSTLAV